MRLTIRPEAQKLIDSVNQKHAGELFYTPKTANHLIEMFLSDGLGYSVAMDIVYEPLKVCDTWQELVLHLRSLGYSYNRIVLEVRLIYGKSNYSQVVRICDPKQAELHRARDREYQARTKEDIGALLTCPLQPVPVI